MKNKILYLLNTTKLDKLYKGEPVYIYNFIDLETFEKVSVGQCYFYNEMQKVYGIEFYENILDLRREYRIIWDTKYNAIKPVNNFAMVKIKYELLKTKLNNLDILYNELLNSLTLTKGKTFKIK